MYLFVFEIHVISDFAVRYWIQCLKYSIKYPSNLRSNPRITNHNHHHRTTNLRSRAVIRLKLQRSTRQKLSIYLFYSYTKSECELFKQPPSETAAQLRYICPTCLFWRYVLILFLQMILQIAYLCYISRLGLDASTTKCALENKNTS